MGMLKFVLLACCVAYTTAEADAVADPYYNYGYSGLGLRSSLGYSGLGYSSLGYSPVVSGYRTGLGYSRLGYGRSLYGKREADADAEPEADPYYNYGYSGLGYNRIGYSGIGSLGYRGIGYSTLGYRPHST